MSKARDSFGKYRENARKTDHVMRTLLYCLFSFSRRSSFFRRRNHLVYLAILFSGLIVSVRPAQGQQAKPEEYQVKATYLYNFSRFIVWPAASGKDQTFDICVLGRDPFGAVLDATVGNESIDDRKLVARRIAAPHEAAGCRILFISPSEASRVKEILTSLEKSSVLTVSDLPGFTSNGGMIQFVVNDNRVRFEVNLAAAEKAGLSLSSQLLKVAADVKR